MAQQQRNRRGGRRSPPQPAIELSHSPTVPLEQGESQKVTVAAHLHQGSRVLSKQVLNFSVSSTEGDFDVLGVDPTDDDGNVRIGLDLTPGTHAVRAQLPRTSIVRTMYVRIEEKRTETKAEPVPAKIQATVGRNGKYHEFYVAVDSEDCRGCTCTVLVHDPRVGSGKLQVTDGLGIHQILLGRGERNRFVRFQVAGKPGISVLAGAFKNKRPWKQTRRTQ